LQDSESPQLELYQMEHPHNKLILLINIDSIVPFGSANDPNG